MKKPDIVGRYVGMVGEGGLIVSGKIMEVREDWEIVVEMVGGPNDGGVFLLDGPFAFKTYETYAEAIYAAKECKPRMP